MPTYDYQCQSCNHPFTVMHKISDPIPECPECGAGDIKKLLSAPAVHGGRSTPSFEAPPCGMPAPMQGGCGSGMCGHKH